MAEMERIEEIDAVCTLDSDSLPLGCKTVIHKTKWVVTEPSSDEQIDESGVQNPHNKKVLKVLQIHLYVASHCFNFPFSFAFLLA